MRYFNIKTMTMAAFAALAVPAAVQAAPTLYPDPGVESPGPGYQYTAFVAGDLMAWFTGPSGAYTVYGGVRVNGVDRPYALSNQTSSYGDTWNFGAVNTFDMIIPYIYVADIDKKYYALKLLNDDGLNHAYATSYAGDAQVSSGPHFAFEDTSGNSDFNYADYGFVLNIVDSRSVPEPATWALMILGFGAIGAALRRRGGAATTRISYR